MIRGGPVVIVVSPKIVEQLRGIGCAREGRWSVLSSDIEGYAELLFVKYGCLVEDTQDLIVARGW